MSLVKLALKRETVAPVLALLFASSISVALVVARILWTGNLRYVFLIWNLFLAWLPLALALLALKECHSRPGKNWRFRFLSLAWLLFYPNAPYIFTDVIHLTNGLYRHFWADLVLILLCALTGLVLGFVSLFLMQSVVRGRFGSLMSWLFIALVACMSGFGICLGRFLRFNSWDVVFRPVELYRGVGSFATSPLANPGSLALPMLFATFLFIAYLMLYALTHLQEIRPEELPAGGSGAGSE